MDNSIFDKTDRGREEIATRMYHLASRLRSLLVMIDGKQGTADLLHKVAGLGLTIDSFTELAGAGFIRDVGVAASSAAPASGAASGAAAPGPASGLAASGLAASGPASGPVFAAPQAAQGVPAVAAAAPPPGAGSVEQILALHAFFNGTIKNAIGLRGFSLQLKAERAVTLADFGQLREPFLAAVLKSKGIEMALSLGDRLDHLLSNAAA